VISLIPARSTPIYIFVSFCYLLKFLYWKSPINIFRSQWCNWDWSIFTLYIRVCQCQMLSLFERSFSTLAVLYRTKLPFIKYWRSIERRLNGKKQTDMLIQSTLIIAREVGIIIASSQTQSCATNFVEKRWQGEREKKKEKNRSTDTSLAGLIDGRVAMFIIRARRFRFTV